MATYFTAPAHKRLNVFFGELFREMRKAPPQAYGQYANESATARILSTVGRVTRLNKSSPVIISC